jgi:hypothetical protein
LIAIRGCLDAQGRLGIHSDFLFGDRDFEDYLSCRRTIRHNVDRHRIRLRESFCGCGDIVFARKQALEGVFAIVTGSRRFLFAGGGSQRNRGTRNQTAEFILYYAAEAAARLLRCDGSRAEN